MPSPFVHNWAFAARGMHLLFLWFHFHASLFKIRGCQSSRHPNLKHEGITYSLPSCFLEALIVVTSGGKGGIGCWVPFYGMGVQESCPPPPPPLKSMGESPKLCNSLYQPTSKIFCFSIVEYLNAPLPTYIYIHTSTHFALSYSSYLLMWLYI